jgi:anti-anti-sigma factor
VTDLAIDVDGVEGAQIVVLRVSGDVDAHTCDKLDLAVQGALSEGVDRVIVDFSDVGYTSSRGLGVLISARKALEDRGGALVLLNPNDSVRAAMGVLGLDSVFSIAGNKDEAIKLAGG